MVELGDEVKSIVTGEKGIVIGISEWLTGCRTIDIKDKIQKDKKEVEATWHDEVTLKVVKKRALKFAPTIRQATKDRGGPREIPQRTLRPGR